MCRGNSLARLVVYSKAERGGYEPAKCLCGATLPFWQASTFLQVKEFIGLFV